MSLLPYDDFVWLCYVSFIYVDVVGSFNLIADDCILFYILVKFGFYGDYILHLCFQVHLCMSRGETFPNLHGQLDVTGLAFHIFDAPSSFSVCPSFICWKLFASSCSRCFFKVLVCHMLSILLLLVCKTTVFVMVAF